MKAWAERPAELSFLLNPAFCGLILHEFFHWYQKASDKDVPYALAFVPLPIVLPARTRSTLTASTRQLQTWISANEPVQIELGRMTRDMLPFTREALVFLAQRKLVQLTADGAFHVSARLPGASKVTGETLEMIQAVARLAKLAASAGNPDTIYVQLGLRP